MQSKLILFTEHSILKSDLMHGLGTDIEPKLERDYFVLNICDCKYHFLNLFNDTLKVSHLYNTIGPVDQVMLYTRTNINNVNSVSELFYEFVMKNHILKRTHTIKWLYLNPIDS